MTTVYQALARKWRPHSFQEVVGQAPVVQALINSLNQNRLHHAYLFTGTRGVGKTSIARLFAKCLNCVGGITAEPCGTCPACQSIDQGRFLDLIEVDAASRTKVEDTRELLENVQYSPTLGRYKIYLIDEVHMLSNHSFNALLKTLEEPPPHVKFLLATTDPQKLPVTVLSRCLQFHLKNLSAEQITAQLAHVLTGENISYELPGLQYLAHAAQGSMRDALSLLDQSVGYGNGKVYTEDVKHMLGATTPELLLNLLSTLIDKNAEQILATIGEISASGVDFHHVLEDFLLLLHQIALLQAVPTLSEEQAPLRKEAQVLSTRLSPEDLQLYYQIALIGRRDLPLAPTPRSGFEMILLRMLAFHPEPSTVNQSLTSQSHSTPPPKSTDNLKTHPTKPMPTTTTSSYRETPMTAIDDENWTELLPKLDLRGVSLIVASHCTCVKKNEDEITLLLDTQHAAMLNKTVEQRIADAIKQYFQKTVDLTIITGQSTNETPMAATQRKAAQAQSKAIKDIHEDNYLNELIDTFDAQIISTSAKPKKD